MRIVVVSDTHGRDEELDKVVFEEAPFDMLVHCGDVEGREIHIEALVEEECHIVSGNNDFFTDLPAEDIIEIGSHRIMVTHGHYYGVSSGDFERLAEGALSRKCDIVIFGHIHMPVYEKCNGVLVLNPGSLSFPRQRGRRSSYMIVDIDEKERIDVQIKYL